MADLSKFDPNSIGLSTNNIFGLPFEEADARLVLVPVPWEVTVSYRPGTAHGPEQVFNSSLQVDLYDADVKDAWKQGYYMQPVEKSLLSKSDYLRHCAELIISHLSEGGIIEENEQLTRKLTGINQAGEELRQWVFERTKKLMQDGKLVGLLGGDHSTPLGFIEAVAEQHGEIGILQIDAHADLRKAYEGFTFSHASIMYNVMEMVPGVTKLVQVGIRDYCDEEMEYMNASNGRIKTFFDKDIKERMYEGENWKQICETIVEQLPSKVYISFDIDGLDPKLCPNTGTPVHGGFEVDQINYLFRKVVESGRTIVAFDLNEISCGTHSGLDTMDANVGARVLYKLCNFLIASNPQ